MKDVIGKKYFELDARERDALPDLVPKRRKLAPRSAKLIKKTHSVCPTCKAVISADVCEEEGAAVMYKRCAQHGESRGVIDPDVGFYRRVMNTAPVARKPYFAMVIPVTHRCNLDCALCFVPKRDRDDLSLEQLKAVIKATPGVNIGVSGGEPTLRDDLPDLIRWLKANDRHCQLISNGIKLADRSYVRQLVDAGLNECLFSFNGFSDKFFRVINGKPLLDIKLKALRNCVEEGIYVALSPTIFRDLNEEDLGPLLQLCLENNPGIFELRVRGACRVGRHGVMRPLATSELLDPMASALGVQPSKLVRELDRKCSYHAAIQFNMHGTFKEHPSEYELKRWDAGLFHRAKDLRQLGEEFVAWERQRSGAILSSEAILEQHKRLAINLWSWPDADNIDFQEIHGHGVYHLYDNSRPMNFCEAVLAAEQL